MRNSIIVIMCISFCFSVQGMSVREKFWRRAHIIHSARRLFDIERNKTINHRINQMLWEIPSVIQRLRVMRGVRYAQLEELELIEVSRINPNYEPQFQTLLQSVEEIQKNRLYIDADEDTLHRLLQWHSALMKIEGRWKYDIELLGKTQRRIESSLFCSLL